jgi:hypothetical protein
LSTVTCPIESFEKALHSPHGAGATSKGDLKLWDAACPKITNSIYKKQPNERKHISVYHCSVVDLTPFLPKCDL